MARNAALLTLVLAVGLLGCVQKQPSSLGKFMVGEEQKNNQDRVEKTMPEIQTVRKPAVAGLFYPRDPGELRRTIERYLREATPEPVENLRALVCPHAGYQYSGPVAAWGYKLLQGKQFNTVIVLAPSHFADFRGIEVSLVDAFETPLGTVRVSPLARELAQRRPFGNLLPCYVSRPEWAALGSGSLPEGRETAQSWEHSLEVQLPFLQVTVQDFELIPAVFGRVDAEAAAEVLADFVDKTTLIVASSDLSHYHSYERARQLDLECVDAICKLDIGRMKNQEACGQLPILTVMHLAKKFGWQAKLLDYRNSGDTAGMRSSVVGYAAIAFFGPAPERSAVKQASQNAESSQEASIAAEDESRLTASEKQFLLQLARQALETVVRTGKLPEVDASQVPERLKTRRACFVTLTKHGELRGCIGTLVAQAPLYLAVMDRAKAAALEDPRFLPVRPEELNDIEIEISVLSEPKPLEFSSPEDLISKLRPGIDGVVLKVGPYQATFLPQVWEKLPDPEQFLSRLAEKAGLSASAWRRPDAKVLVYQVEAFSEGEH